MAGIWKRLFDAMTAPGDDTSIVFKTRGLGLERGDFCRTIHNMPGLRSGSEVMVSTVYKDKRNVDVIDYNHRYHKVYEMNLKKL